MVNEYPPRQKGRWKECGVVCGLLVVGLAVALAVVVVLKNKELEEKLCASGDENIDISEQDNPSVFSDLTTVELRSVVAYLYQQTDLNVVKLSDATLSSSYIYLIELNVPNKTAVLNHLDNQADAPERRAKVVIFRGDLDVPRVEEYEVGPLPNPTFHTIIYRNGKDSVPFTYRPFTLKEYEGLGRYIFFAEIEQKGRRILLESFDASFIDCGTKCLTFYITPVSTSNYGKLTRNMWFWINHDVKYYALHPLDFKVLVNLDGTDPSKFKITKVWYNQQLFNSMDDLVSAYENNKVEKIVMKFPQVDESTFSTLNQRGEPFPSKPLRSPVQVEPDGKRYTIKGQHVEYMGWAFDYRMALSTGPMLFNVRYRGERIAYEISLQEIVVFYSANNPSHRFADFVDSISLIGSLSKALIPGSDCPDHSTFLPSRHVLEASSEPVVYENSLCIFEQATGVPLRRHHSYGKHAGWFYGGMMDDVLILRTILTAANYDYIFDFIFHQNGAIEVKAISTGYILPSVFSPSEKKYGFQIHDNILGNVHHHMFNFKVDVDILGTSNRFETLDLKVEAAPNQMYSELSSAQTYNQIYFQSNPRRTEKAASYKFNFDQPKYLLFNNDQFTTKHGVPRSYRVVINGMSKQTLPENSGHENSITWSRYQMAVTKYKDTEKQSSSLYAMWDAFQPVNRFQSFIDNDESIVDQDLVAWITMGVHHIPHTEDLPVTPTPGGQLQFFLLPYNYFTEDPSSGSKNAIYMELKHASDNSAPTVDINRYGYGGEPQCVPQKSTFDQQVAEDPDLVFSTSG
ncbi:putative amine oxidase [copper-containing] [Liolophura sinensis]|uniref:putative amine oxidase [copper-containing] n=1 Tax=Liolophura sinensis TaxID=3198878 RepID=UPI003158A575